MTSNIRAFELRINRYCDVTLPKIVKIQLQKVALVAIRRIVFRTAVDTGHARANWQVTLGSPAEGIIEDFDKDGNITISRGSDVILKVDPFGIIWITNNLPYILPLEQGSSKQHPSGMVAVTIPELEAMFK